MTRIGAAAVLVVVVLACWPLVGSASTGAQARESLGAARDLYAAAAYFDALAMLDVLRQRKPSGDEAIEIEKYRAFCLVALGRTADAEESIARILAVQPRFHLGEEEVSHRVFAVFEDARRRALPQVAQQAYERAKQAYDRQEFELAGRGFTLVLALADEPGASADGRLMRDLRTLAGGFLGLIAASTQPVSSKALVPPVPIAPATKVVYDASDTGVVPPAVVEQQMPRWPAGVRAGGTAVLEVLVNQRGEVESARLAVPFNSPYDDLLLSAASTWRYRPALCGREPVKFLRRVQIVAGAQ